MIMLQDVESLSLGSLKKGEEVKFENKEIEKEYLKLGYIGKATTPKTPSGVTEVEGTDKQLSEESNS